MSANLSALLLMNILMAYGFKTIAPDPVTIATTPQLSSNTATTQVSFATGFTENSTMIIKIETIACNSSEPVNKSNCTDDNTNAAMQESSDYVGYVSVPLLLVVGICGNILTICIMRNTQFRATTFSLILTALSVSDTVLITTLPFNKDFVRKLLGTDIRAISAAGCKTYFFFFRSSKMTSSWFVVFLAFERFLAVWFPLRVKEISSKRNISIAIAIVYIVMCTLNGIWTFSSELVNNVCVPNLALPGIENLSAGFLLMGTMLYFFIPAAILVVITPLTVIKLFKHDKLRRKLTKGRVSSSDEIMRTTVMLVGVTVAFLILVAPIATAHLIAFFRKDHIFESKDPLMVIYRNVSQLMEQTNYAVNFFVYVICNKTFRNRCLSIMGCRNSRVKKETITCVTLSESVKLDSIATISN